MEKYVFEESLGRINETMSYSVPFTQDSIPDVEGTSEKQSCFVNATVVYVIIETAADSPQVMQSFLAEACKIAKAHENCKDVICVEDRLVFIYSSAYKAELGYALDDAARVRSLAMVVSKIGRQKGYGDIKVKIGMDYGLVEMYLMGKDENGSAKYAWRGSAIMTAKKNAEDARDEIIITRVVWNNLSENNQKLFSIH